MKSHIDTKMIRLSVGILCAILLGSISMASISKAQVASQNLYSSNDRLTGSELTVSDTKLLSLESALQQIQKNYEVSFLYDSDILKGKYVRASLLQADNMGLMLSQALTRNGLTYSKESEQQYAIMEKPLFDINLLRKAAQLETVSGTVTDAESGDTLPGVNVLVKGTTTGASTNSEGYFELNVPSLQDTLVFSFIGYQSQEVPINGRTSIEVVMQTQAIEGEELIVVGYGSVKEQNLTGSVSSVNMEDLASRPITSSSTALQGQAPGVYALQNSGRAGGDDATLRIRGVGTLNNSDPLVVIDGVPGDINDVNPQDIESISVLKDAASASIYGSRAANGVVLVTTKTGTSNELELSYNGQFGWQQPTSLPNVLNSLNYAQLVNEAQINSGQPIEFTEEEIDKIRQGNDWRYPNNDMFDVMYDDFVPMQNHHIDISGGSEDLQYAFMLGYQDQEGILVGNNHDQVSFRSNLNASYLEEDRLRVSAKLSGNRGETANPLHDWETRWYAAVAPTFPLKNDQGEWATIAGEDNFYAQTVEGSINTNYKNVYNGQVAGELDIVQGLTAEVTYGFQLTQNRWEAFQANVRMDNLDGTYKTIPSSLNEENREDTQSMFNTLLRFQNAFGEHEVNALAGYQQEYFETRWSEAFRRNLINNSQQVISLGDPATQSTGGGASDLGMESFFGRLGYVYDDRYMVEANIRKDGSSRFAEGNQWGVFPSFSAGWNVTEEAFMPDIAWLDFLKVRASWGKLGNENIFSRYAATNILNSGANYVTGGSLRSGVAMTSLANEAVTWETTTQTNVGMDIDVFENFSFTLDYFQRDTEDILMQIPIPIIMGNLAPPFQNVGGVSNSGIEFSGSYSTQFDNGLFLNAKLNLSHVKNEITDLHGRSPIIQGETVLKEGSPIHSFYGYKTDGLYQIEDFTWQNNSDQSIAHVDRNYTLKDGVVDVSNYTPVPGDLKYVDLDGDGIVTMDNDRTVIGDQQPDLNYSFQLNSAYKNFDFGLFLQGVFGINGYTSAELINPVPNFGNSLSLWMDRWTPENPDEDVPRVTREGSKTGIPSEWYLEDASYLRIKNVELGYTIPQSLTSQVGISQLRVYANVQNAYTFDNYRGFDPEQPTSETRAQAYPQVRIYNLGININF